MAKNVSVKYKQKLLGLLGWVFWFSGNIFKDKFLNLVSSYFSIRLLELFLEKDTVKISLYKFFIFFNFEKLSENCKTKILNRYISNSENRKPIENFCQRPKNLDYWDRSEKKNLLVGMFGSRNRKESVVCIFPCK